MEKVKCSRCKGKGYHWDKIRNPGTCQYEKHIVTCFMPGCHGGIMNRQENYQSFMARFEISSN